MPSSISLLSMDMGSLSPLEGMVTGTDKSETMNEDFAALLAASWFVPEPTPPLSAELSREVEPMGEEPLAEEKSLADAPLLSPVTTTLPSLLPIIESGMDRQMLTLSNTSPEIGSMDNLAIGRSITTSQIFELPARSGTSNRDIEVEPLPKTSAGQLESLVHVMDNLSTLPMVMKEKPSPSQLVETEALPNTISLIDKEVNKDVKSRETTISQGKVEDLSSLSLTTSPRMVVTLPTEQEAKIKNVLSLNTEWQTATPEPTRALGEAVRMVMAEVETPLADTLTDSKQIEKHLIVLNTQPQQSEPQTNESFSAQLSMQMDTAQAVRLNGDTKLNNVNGVAVAEQVLSPIMEVANRLTPPETRRLRIELHPDELGPVEVELARNVKGHLSACLMAKTDIAHYMLNEGISHLRASLEQAGIVVDQLDVRMDLNTQTGDSGHSNANDQDERAAYFFDNLPTLSANRELNRGSLSDTQQRLLSLRI
jgi:hypothetical protein